jgi:hypothetical protein
VCLVCVNLLSFVWQPPTSRYQSKIGTSGIGVIGINNELAEHWAQGYHCGIDESRRDLLYRMVFSKSVYFQFSSQRSQSFLGLSQRPQRSSRFKNKENQRFGLPNYAILCK